MVVKEGEALYLHIHIYTMYTCIYTDMMETVQCEWFIKSSVKVQGVSYM